MTNAPKTDSLLPVRLVLRRTGLSADVLRAWERRYGAVRPQRTPGGQRLYREEDVTRLEHLRRLTILGHSIGQVARLPDAEIETMLARASIPSSGRAEDDLAPDVLRSTCLRAVERMDALLLDATLRRAAIALGPLGFAERVAGPLVTQVGEMWHRGALRVGQERLGSTTIRSVLSWLCHAAAPAAGSPSIVVATMPGQSHELGAMMAAAVASAEGHAVLYLGPDVPPVDIADVARSTRARNVAVSFVLPATVVEIERQVRELRELLGPQVTIFVGGSAAAEVRPRLEKLGATHVVTLPQFREALRREG